MNAQTSKMDYDFRNRQNPPYESHQYGLYKPPSSTSSSSSHPMYAPPPQPSMYPRVNPTSHSARSGSAPGLGIRVGIKPEYRITPPPQLSPQIGDIPHITFHFDFDVERKILAEAQKDSQNWSRLGLENLPPRTTGPSSMGVTDPVMDKYIALGMDREAVPYAVANYGDNPILVKEFVNSFTLLREMGFASKNIAEVLNMYDNDADKALAYFLNSS